MGMIISAISSLMYFSEKITLCFTWTALVICIMVTLITTLGLGIGLGYNYCFVDIKTRYRYVPPQYRYPGSPRWPYNRYETRRNRDVNPADYELESLKGLTISTTELDVTSTVNTTPIEEPVIKENITNKALESKDATIEENINMENNDTANVETTNIDNEHIDMASEVTENILTLHKVTKSSDTITNSTKKNNDVTSTLTTLAIEVTAVTASFGSITEDMSPPKMIIPISGLDLIALLSKLRSENRNYSLQIVTS